MKGTEMKTTEGTHACSGSITLSFQAHCHSYLNEGNGRRNEREERKSRNNTKTKQNDFFPLMESEGPGEGVTGKPLLLRLSRQQKSACSLVSRGNSQKRLHFPLRNSVCRERVTWAGLRCQKGAEPALQKLLWSIWSSTYIGTLQGIKEKCRLLQPSLYKCTNNQTYVQNYKLLIKEAKWVSEVLFLSAGSAGLYTEVRTMYTASLGFQPPSDGLPEPSPPERSPSPQGHHFTDQGSDPVHPTTDIHVQWKATGVSFNSH